MIRLLTILLIALLFEAIGVVLLSRGLKEIGDLKQFNVAGLTQLVVRGARNPHVIIGIFFEALFFAGLLTLMSKADVSFIWPLTSLGFVVTTLAAKFYLHEHISGLRWSGVCLIMMGAALITWTERQTAPPSTEAALTRAATEEGRPPQ